ncbi:MAG: hypothetical protein AAB774_02695 [Patescibacteria group bacterium]
MSAPHNLTAKLPRLPDEQAPNLAVLLAGIPIANFVCYDCERNRKSVPNWVKPPYNSAQVIVTITPQGSRITLEKRLLCSGCLSARRRLG